MALNKERLKEKIRTAFKAEQTESEDYNASLERISAQLAEAVIEEIKQLQLTYTSGLTAPNGPVAGSLNVTID